MLRFHVPLIEPDVRISRIRLSDKGLMGSPTGSSGLRWQLAQAQFSVQIRIRVASRLRDPAPCASRVNH